MCNDKKTFGRKQKCTEIQILEAIKGSAGIKTTIAKRLGISFHTLQSYIKKYDSVKDALLDEEETVLDMAEGNLFKLIQNGDVSAIFYFLNNKGKRRGYGFIDKKQTQEQAQTDEHKTGVLISPGLFSEDTWETEAAKK